MLQITGTGDTILNQLRGAGILLESPCNGKGLCGKCRVRLLRGKAGPVTPEEKAFLTSEELHSGIRLACLAVPEGPVEVDPLGLLSADSSAILGEGVLPPFVFDPAVSCLCSARRPCLRTRCVRRLWSGRGYRHHDDSGHTAGFANRRDSRGGWIPQPSKGLRPGRAVPHPLCGRT